MAGKTNGSHFIIRFLLFQKIANQLPVLSSRFGSVLDITNVTHLICLFIYVSYLFKFFFFSQPVLHLFISEIKIIFFLNGSQNEAVFLRKLDSFKIVIQKSLPVL